MRWRKNGRFWGGEISLWTLHDFYALGNTGCEKAVVWVQEFRCKTKIFMGEDALQGLSSFRGKRLLLVTDPFFVKSGDAKRIQEQAGAGETRIFDRIEPDPTVMLAAEGTALVKEFQPEVIVALGGGSTMDCAKAMAYFGGAKASLVAIPTTSGSGSEVTNFAILTHNSIKHPLVDEKLQPDIAILEESFLQGLPAGLVADAGMDVLTHALEALVAKNANPVTDALAKESFCTVFAALPASFAGHIPVRGRIHVASTMAGLAFSQSGLGACHALAHSLGGMYHVPHGRLNAILLPAVISCNAAVAGEKYARLAIAAGLGGSAISLGVRNLKNGIIRLRKELKLPATLAQAGIQPSQVWKDTPRIVAAALEDGCLKTNPVEIEGFMLRKILDEVTGNG